MKEMMDFNTEIPLSYVLLNQPIKASAESEFTSLALTRFFLVDRLDLEISILEEKFRISSF
jgi:hypothetical protein